jgi:putative spermidine/putrescine transport system permease protein
MSAIPPHASPLERAWAWTFRILCGAVFLFLIAPILVIIPLSFNAEAYFTFTEKMLTLDPAGYSLRWYDNLLTFGMTAPDAPRDAAWWADSWANATWIRAAKNSLIVGVFSTLLATVLGTVAALGLARSEMPGRKAVMAILISPMIVPVIISATGVFFFYSNPGFPLPYIRLSPFEVGLAWEWRLTGTYLGIVLAHTVLGIPFVIITVTATLVGFDRSLLRASASLGAGPVRTFWRVQLPLILPGVISGALFAFVTSFDEVVMVLFVGGHDQQTIPRQMWVGIREQLSPSILAVATILVLVSVALLTAVELLRRRSERLRGLSPG